MALTWLDWLFIALLTVTAVTGFLRGLIREALGLAAWVIALLAARVLAQPVADLLAGSISTASAMRAWGPLVIRKMRSASRIASSTSWVIMNTVWRSWLQILTSSS